MNSLRVIYWNMLAVACGIMFPTYAIFGAGDYFNAILPNHDVMFYISLIASIPAVPVCLIMLKFSKCLSVSARLYLGFIIIAIIDICYPLIHFFKSDTATLWITYSLSFIVGIVSVFQQCTMFALTDHLDPSITQASMLGIAVSGVITAILRVISKAAVTSDYNGNVISGYIYFGSAFVYNIFCFISMYYLGKDPMIVPYWRFRIENEAPPQSISFPSNHQLRKSGIINEDNRPNMMNDFSTISLKTPLTFHDEESVHNTPIPSPTNTLLSPNANITSQSQSQPVQFTVSLNNIKLSEQQPIQLEKQKDVNNKMEEEIKQQQQENRFNENIPNIPEASPKELTSHFYKENPSFLHVLVKEWYYILCITLIFAENSIVYPAILSNTDYDDSMGKDVFNNGWFTVFLIAAHCTMDCIGRYSSGKYCIKPMIIGVIIVIRICCIPFFILTLKAIIPSVWLFVFDMLLAFTTGYCGSCAMMLSSNPLERAEYEYGGFIMSTDIQVGIFIGSLIGSQLDSIK